MEALIVLLFDTGLSQFIPESSYLLLENETRSPRCYGHTSKYPFTTSSLMGSGCIKHYTLKLRITPRHPDKIFPHGLIEHGISCFFSIVQSSVSLGGVNVCSSWSTSILVACEHRLISACRFSPPFFDDVRNE